MTDLHTHILPHMDDGPEDVAVSIQMLQMERQQGVDKVVFTPHFYHDKETVAEFLSRREESYRELRTAVDKLPKEERDSLPDMFLGAEVAWRPDITGWEGLEKLCYEGTKYLLLELPVYPWSKSMLHRLNDLMTVCGVTPVIAHIDRYFSLQSSKMLDELYYLGLPTQLSVGALKYNIFTRHKALTCLRDGTAQLLISDCHSVGHRRPNMGDGMRLIRLRLGKERAEKLQRETEAILTE